MNHAVKFVTLAVVLAAPLAVFASPERGERPGPPPEAIEACASAEEGDACSFEGRNDDIVEGTCMPGPVPELPLACRPAGGAPPPRGSRG